MFSGWKLPVALVVAIVVLLLALSFGGWAKGLWWDFRGHRQINALETQVKESQEALQGYEQAQLAIQNLSKQIASLRQEADRHKARADAAGREAAELRTKLTKLDAERAALPRVLTGMEAASALSKRGY